MAEKKVTRKVISKGRISSKGAKKEPIETAGQTEDLQKADSPREAILKEGEAYRSKKACFFHQSKTEPSYTDIAVLRRFLSDRAKIVSRAKNSLCSKHQRLVSTQIKYARHLALLPFTPKV